MAIPDYSFFIPGDSRGVLLIHGLTGTPAEMKYLGRKLAAAGFTVYGMQLAGHCGGRKDLLRTGWMDWYESIERAHDWLAQRCEVVFAAGLSVGATLTLHLAACRPGALAGIALYSTTIWNDGWSVSIAHPLLPLAAYLPFVSRISIPEGPPYGIKDERMRQMIVSRMKNGDSGAAGLSGTPIASLLEMQHLIDQVKSEIQDIHTPALVVHTLEDDISSMRNARYLEKNLGGPVTLRILNDSFHMITIDRQRMDVARYSQEFFGINAEVSEEILEMSEIANG